MMLALNLVSTVAPLLSPRVVPATTARVASTPRLVATSPVESTGWPQLQGRLDELPIFTVANEQGQPLQYEIGGRPVAVFYADVDAAKTELAAAKGQYPDLNCDLVPVGLGSAYKLSCDNKAMVVPGIAELRAAGAPEGAQPLGQDMPLFACMKMSREGDDGPVLPLFMSHADCAAAIAQATEADSPDEPLEISGLALSSVVEQLVQSSGAFSFVPPSASMKHIEAYVGQGVYWRPADEPAA